MERIAEGRFVYSNPVFATLEDNESIMKNIVAGWSSLVARRAHNPKVVGSNPAPATRLGEKT